MVGEVGGVVGEEADEVAGGAEVDDGDAVGAILVEDHDEAMLITNGGTLVRTRVAEVSVIGRNTQGVTLIRLPKDEKLVAMARVEHEEGDDELIDAMKEDGTFEVESQEQIDIDATTDNTATTDVDDAIDIANDHKPSDNL